MYYRLTSDNENFRNYRFPKKLSSKESVELSESFDWRSYIDSYETINFEMTLASEKEYPVADEEHFGDFYLHFFDKWLAGSIDEPSYEENVGGTLPLCTAVCLRRAMQKMQLVTQVPANMFL